MRFDSDIVTVSTATTAVQVLNSNNRVVKIKFTAPPANSGLTYVGHSDVSATNGFVLGAAGGIDATTDWIDFSPGSIALSTFYIDAATDDDTVAWIAVIADGPKG